MIACPAAIRNVRVELLDGIPVNSQYNRTKLAEAHAADGDDSMTPAMCGFWLQALVIDRASDRFRKLEKVAHRIHATYEGDGMGCHYAVAAAMRVNLEQPTLFNEIATSE
jgi:hypothetical protein